MTSWKHFLDKEADNMFTNDSSKYVVSIKIINIITKTNSPMSEAIDESKTILGVFPEWIWFTFTARGVRILPHNLSPNVHN